MKMLGTDHWKTTKLIKLNAENVVYRHFHLRETVKFRRKSELTMAKSNSKSKNDMREGNLKPVFTSIFLIPQRHGD